MDSDRRNPASIAKGNLRGGPCSKHSSLRQRVFGDASPHSIITAQDNRQIAGIIRSPINFGNGGVPQVFDVSSKMI